MVDITVVAVMVAAAAIRAAVLLARSKMEPLLLRWFFCPSSFSRSSAWVALLPTSQPR